LDERNSQQTGALHEATATGGERMIDWYVWLTPLALLPIAAFFLFVGCGKQLTVAEADEPAPAPPEEGEGKPGGNKPGPTNPGPLPPKPPAPTVFQVNWHKDLNVKKDGFKDYKVTQITAVFNLRKKAVPAVQKDVSIQCTPTDPNRTEIDPTKDPEARHILTDSELLVYDQVRIRCVMKLAPAAGTNLPPSPDASAPKANQPEILVDIAKETMVQYELQPVWNNPNIPASQAQREFKLERIL
jgi:hypothetical protein